MDFGSRSMAVYFLFSTLILSAFPETYAIGVNYGRVASNLPTPAEVARLCSSIHVDVVRIFDAAPEVVSVFGAYDIDVIIAIPNDEVHDIGANETLADVWVRRNVLVHVNGLVRTRVSTIVVGNELLSDVNYSGEDIVPAMRNIHAALLLYGLDRIHVSSAHPMSILNGNFWPPSAAEFDTRIRISVMAPLLEFLSQTGSPLLLNAYPYLVYKYDPDTVSIDTALFNTNEGVTDPNSGLLYTNLFDQMVDAFYSAMAVVGYSDIDIVVSETGWPTLGGSDEHGASVTNAKTYITNLARHVAPNLALGTPRKPGRPVSTLVFALFNEDGKWGPDTERNWGMFYPNMTKVYDAALDI